MLLTSGDMTFVYETSMLSATRADSPIKAASSALVLRLVQCLRLKNLDAMAHCYGVLSPCVASSTGFTQDP